MSGFSTDAGGRDRRALPPTRLLNKFISKKEEDIYQTVLGIKVKS
jgi:hypothetical protein